MFFSRFRPSIAVLALTLVTFAKPLPAIGAPLHPHGLQFQFGGFGGMAAGKVMQQFHLPSSPTDLFEFVLEYSLKQKIGNTLPLNLNANAAFPTVENAQLPGGAFQGKALPTSAGNLRTALAPGDYVVPVMAYCTQYSVHRAGEGTAYKLAPVQGTQGEAIATLLWRGTLAGKRPQDLQATNWTIQSGITYGSMPKPYQALIDQLIPDYRDKLKGNMLDIVQTTYRDVTTDPRRFLQMYIKEKYNTTVPLMILPKIAVPAPPIEVVLAKMGPAGQMVLDARRQSTIFLTSYTTKELGEQTLFQGQGEQLPPEPAGEGPWTVRVPGQAYMRFIVKSGNMHGDNLMQIRILPNTQTAAAESTPHLVQAAYQVAPVSSPAAAAATVPATSVYGLLGVKTAGDATSDAGVLAWTSSGVIGYSVGGEGAQALVPVVAKPHATQPPAALVTVLVHNRTYYQLDPSKVPDKKDAAASTGLCMYLGAKISDPDHVYQEYRWIQKVHVEGPGKCGTDYVDPCDDDAPDPQHAHSEVWYRPPSLDAAWADAGKELGNYDTILRDEPARRISDTQTRAWTATTELIGMGADHSYDEHNALAVVKWGFEKNGRGNLLPTAVTINGVAWQGRPSLTASKEQEAAYLCDPYQILALPDSNEPLPPVPPNYSKEGGYRLYP